jgi:hypothetical protein
MGMLPSVTTVLGVLREEYLERWKMSEAIRNFQRIGNVWRAVEEHYSRDSKESAFGTDVHDIVHRFVTGQEMPAGHTEAHRHAAPAIDWIKQEMKELLHSETTISCKKTGAAGTIDLAFLNKDNKRILADIKVVKIRDKFPPKPSLGYRCQLSAYAEMLRAKEGEEYERISLYLASPFGDQKLPKIMTFAYQKSYLEEFQSCLNLWHAQYGLGYEELKDNLLKNPSDDEASDGNNTKNVDGNQSGFQPTRKKSTKKKATPTPTPKKN